MTALFNRRGPRFLLFGVLMLAGIGLTGCQVDIGGQTLPSAHYMSDDVQYYPPGSEFKLANEAAAMKAYSQEQAQEAYRR